MRKLLVLVALVLIVLVAADFGARAYSQSQWASSAQNKVLNVRSVSVDFNQRPFLLNLALTGKVKDATIKLHDITDPRIDVSLLTVHATDLDTGRGAMVGGDAKINGAKDVGITANLTVENVVNALNSGALVFRDKFVTGTVDGHNVQGPLTISGRYIVINDPTHPVKIPLPSVNYLPCTPTSAYVWENSPIVVGCTSPVLPPALVTTLGSKALQKSVAK